MLQAIKGILGGGSVIEKGFDLIDSIHDSDSEIIQAKANAKIGRLKAYEPFKVAQRILAIMFASVFLLCFMIVLGFVLYSWATGALVDAVQDAASADAGVLQMPLIAAITAIMSAFKLPWIMGTIILFYFGGGLAEGFQEKKRQRQVDRERAKQPQKDSERPGPPK